MPADSCGTILAIALFPRWQRAAGVQLDHVTLLVEFAAGFSRCPSRLVLVPYDSAFADGPCIRINSARDNAEADHRTAPERNGTCPVTLAPQVPGRACHERLHSRIDKSSVVSLKAVWSATYAHAGVLQAMLATPCPSAKGMAARFMRRHAVYPNTRACAVASTQPLSLIYSLAP